MRKKHGVNQLLFFSMAILLASHLLWGCAEKKPLVIETEKDVPPAFEEIDQKDEDVLPEPVLSPFEILKQQAEALIASGSTKAALYVYNQALSEADEEQKEQLFYDIEPVVSAVNSSVIEELLMSKETVIPESILLYRLGMNFTADGQYQKAVDVLTDFVERYPDHKDAPDAVEILVFLNENALDKDTIGCLLPLSGKFSIFGQRALKGIELAMLNLSKEYSLDLTILIKDTSSDNNRAEKAVQELALEKVAAIAGPIITAAAAGDEAQKQGIPLIAMTQKKEFASRGDYLFSNFLTPEMQARALVSYTFGHLGVTKFAILYPEDKYGETYMNLFWDMVDDIGGEIVGAESYSNDQTDFSDAIRKMTGLYYPVPDFLKDQGEYESDFNEKSLLLDGNQQAYLEQWDIYSDSHLFGNMESMDDDDSGFTPQSLLVNSDQNLTDETVDIDEEKEQPIVDFNAIFIPDSPSKVGLILPQLVYHDVTGLYLVGPNIWHDDTLIESAKGYVKNAVITEGYFAGSRNEKAARFAREFKALHNEEPGFIEAIAYDTIMIIVRTAMEPSIDSRKSLKNALAGKRLFDGVTGRTMFDQNGAPHKELFYLTVQKGKFVEISR